MTRRRAIAIAAIFLVAVAVFFALHRSIVSRRQTDQAAAEQSDRPAGPVLPTLYCDFYNFMHNATVVSFYFAVDLEDHAKPKFSELFVVEPDGSKTEFGSSSDIPNPQWAYSVQDGTPTIVSPDTATDIVLYGFKPESRGTIWTEAGIRSDTYRNLDGKCRQANFNEKKHQGDKP